jgi:hypothetical protein
MSRITQREQCFSGSRRTAPHKKLTEPSPCMDAGRLSSWIMQTVFEAAGGNDGLRRLANAWHRRVMADDVVAHAFSHGFHAQHVERLAAYWAEALGGPTTYSVSYGDETTVVRMHSGGAFF